MFPVSTSGENKRKVGRPRVDPPADRVIEMRESGHSWRAIARKLDYAVTTVRRAYHVAKNGLDPYQNSGRDDS